MEPFNIHNSDWQQLIYLLLILVMLLSSVLVRRSEKFGKTVKFFAAWFAVAIGCVAIYSYRFSFMEVKNRIMDELNPSSARIIKPARLVIDADNEGNFFVDATINGSVIRFLIDQDVNAIVLNHADTKKIVNDISRLVLNSTYYDHGRNVGGASVKIDEMIIADTKIEDLDALVSESDHQFSRLGTTFLSRFESSKISDKKVTLNGLTEAPGKIIIRTSSDGQFYMNVLMNGEQVRCMIDTGASKISLDQSHAKLLNIDIGKLNFDRVMQTANGSSSAADFMLDELAIGGIKFHNIGAILSNGDMGGVCLLGMEFLRRFKKYESFQDKMVLTI